MADYPALEALYPAAFPDEDLLPLLELLLQEQLDAVSLVAMAGARLLGHVVFTPCGIEGSRAEVALLGPLAVSPESQRQGIGSALVRAGLDRLRRQGISAVYVLGDPRYYSRLGFAVEHTVDPPYTLPDEWAAAWQSLTVRKTAAAPHGKLLVPAPWQRPELWAP